MAPELRAVFFDAGGTLLAPHPSVGGIYAEVAREFGLSLDPEAAEAAFHRALRRAQAAARAGGRTLFGFEPAAAKEVWRAVVAEVVAPESLPAGQFDALFDRLFAEFAQGHRYRLLDGALPALAALRRRGLRLGLISNWDHRLRRVLAGLDLDVWLDPIVISCEVGADKPDPAIFRRACEAAGATPREALMVGDSPDTDIAGARQAGLAALLFDPAGWHPGTTPRIERLSDLEGWVREHFALIG